MAVQMTRTDEKAEIRRLLDDWAKAARAKDIDRIFAHYAPCSSRDETRTGRIGRHAWPCAPAR